MTMVATAAASIKKFQNIMMDRHSAYSFEELNETVFLTKFFEHLREILKGSFEDYEFYLYANIDSSIVPDSLSFKTEKKKVLIFLSNQSYDINPLLPGDFFAVFKCHLPDSIVRDKIFHFPLGYVKDTKTHELNEISERKVGVFFSGNLNKKRVSLYKALSGSAMPDILYGPLIRVSKKVPNLIKRDLSYSFPSSYIHFTNGFKKGLNAQEYSKILYDSQIVLCPGGFLKNETYRHFEAMRAGCVIISEKLPNTYLYEQSPIIQVNDWQEGINLARTLLEDPATLQEYHLKTLKWWDEVCSEGATARRVASVLQQLSKESMNCALSSTD